ncbi:hypothetical protein K438DRAFT_1733829 [Mycena galopus ATCC 62051]|nr:hypothetical protein K438DRAFT_1733829 [Mycena galopus ATCC 62051]
MQILDEVSSGRRASKAPPLVSVSYRMASSKKPDETARGRSSPRSSSSFSTSNSIATSTRSRIPGPSNAYPAYSQASQYSLPASPEHTYAFPPGTSSGSHLRGGPFPGASGGLPFIPPHRVHHGAWEEEREACEHTLMLQQTAVDAIPASRLAHCVACELASNLWLCLTCGSLGCGRRQLDGGNGHALNHFEDTGHPVVVKLGTITPEGGAGRSVFRLF